MSAASSTSGGHRVRHFVSAESARRGILYTGTREELRRAGIVGDQPFPGDPGHPSAMIFDRRACAGQVQRIERLGADLFRVRVRYTGPQLQQQRLIERTETLRILSVGRAKEAENRHGVRERSRSAVERVITQLATPAGRARFKTMQRDWFLAQMMAMWNPLGDPDLGFTFHPDIVERSSELVAQMLALFESADLIVSRERLAEADSRFQRHLGRVASRAIGEQDHE